MSDPWVFLDTETFGLGDDHATFEAAWAYEKGDPFSVNFYVSPDDLRRADPQALNINGYEARGLASRPGDMFADVKLRRALAGHRVVCSNPEFDLGNLRRRWGLHRDSPGIPWVRRPVNISDVAFALRVTDEPAGLARIVDALNVGWGAEIEPEGVHTAVSGVVTLRSCWRWLMAIRDGSDVDYVTAPTVDSGLMEA